MLKEKEFGLGVIMRQILSSYVFWYNSKYERIGSLFQDRYKSETIENDSYLLCAARYIHQNPLKAGIVQDISEYKWSSYTAYLNGKESLIDKDLILGILQGQAAYKEFMSLTEEQSFIEPAESFKLTDDKLIKAIKKKLNIREITDINGLSNSERDKKIKAILRIKGSNPTQVARVCGLPRGIIRGLLSR